MDDQQLFDLFCARQVSPAEIAALDLETATRQIRELREHKPDDLALSDQEIAERILQYARAERRREGRGLAKASLYLGSIGLAGCGIALEVIWWADFFDLAWCCGHLFLLLAPLISFMGLLFAVAALIGDGRSSLAWIALALSGVSGFAAYRALVWVLDQKIPWD